MELFLSLQNTVLIKWTCAQLADEGFFKSVSYNKNKCQYMGDMLIFKMNGKLIWVECFAK